MTKNPWAWLAIMVLLVYSGFYLVSAFRSKRTTRIKYLVWALVLLLVGLGLGFKWV